MPDNVSE